jgi:hypothetical protein
VTVACVQRSWRWRAVRDDLFGNTRLVVVTVLGVVLLAGGIALESGPVGTIGILGAGLLTVGLVLPMVTKLTLGTMSFERGPTSREDAVAALAEELGLTLHEVARWLSAAEQERLAAWVRQALAVSYRDCGLVPRSERDLHALCVLVRSVRAGTGMQQMGDWERRFPNPGRDEIRPERLLGIPFDDRAALVLRQVALLDDIRGSQVMHTTPEAFAVGAERAAAWLRQSSAGRA